MKPEKTLAGKFEELGDVVGINDLSVAIAAYEAALKYPIGKDRRNEIGKKLIALGHDCYYRHKTDGSGGEVNWFGLALGCYKAAQNQEAVNLLIRLGDEMKTNPNQALAAYQAATEVIRSPLRS